MLEQTQAERVAARFEAFIERFPSEHVLGSAPLAAVLDEWSGLGYNSRAKRLRDACIIVVESGWPTNSRDLQALPGVGPYTAAAVASFAFEEHIAVVDTNVRRVLSRWQGSPLVADSLAGAAANALPSDAATWNQAVMELGATTCLPRVPRCEACPVAQWCADPTVYEPPARQSRFEGSRRQVRGAVIRVLREGPLGLPALTTRLPSTESLASILEDLAAEGLIRTDGVTWSLPT